MPFPITCRSESSARVAESNDERNLGSTGWASAMTRDILGPTFSVSPDAGSMMGGSGPSSYMHVRWCLASQSLRWHSSS
jgi:hypothetical protein